MTPERKLVMKRKTLLTLFTVLIFAAALTIFTSSTQAKVIYTTDIMTDAAAEKIIRKCTDESMTKEQKLRRVYVYLVKNMTHSYSQGSIKIKVSHKDIKKMKAQIKALKKEKMISFSSDYRKRYRSVRSLRGTCYGQSMAFNIIANHLGFKTKLCHGRYNHNSHYWSRIIINGKKRYFDVDIANYYWKRRHSMSKVNFYYNKAYDSRDWRRNHHGGR